MYFTLAHSTSCAADSGRHCEKTLGSQSPLRFSKQGGAPAATHLKPRVANSAMVATTSAYAYAAYPSKVTLSLRSTAVSSKSNQYTSSPLYYLYLIQEQCFDDSVLLLKSVYIDSFKVRTPGMLDMVGCVSVKPDVSCQVQIQVWIQVAGSASKAGLPSLSGRRR